MPQSNRHLLMSFNSIFNGVKSTISTSLETLWPLSFLGKFCQDSSANLLQLRGPPHLQAVRNVYMCT